MGSNGSVEWWNTNTPMSQRTSTCPEFLIDISDKDIRIISTPDHNYQRQTWDEVRDIVTSNRLELFQRVPSELRRCRALIHRLHEQYGSVATFLLSERLQWEVPITSKGIAFELHEDYKILLNDWPYGLDARIVHMVVWTKFSLEEDPTTGDLTARTRRNIEVFMERTFLPVLEADNAIWFRNWAGLKSVHTVEHFHVMLFDPDPTFVRHVTNGDVPQCQKT